MLADDLAERRHQQLHTVFAHVRQGLEPVASLVEVRERTFLRGVRLEAPIEAAAFARRAEQGEQRLRESGEELEYWLTDEIVLRNRDCM
mgnify:CR=1 FL=1